MDGILGLLKEETEAYKLFKEIQRMITVVKIRMNLERELAANALAAAANPLNAVTAGAAGAAQPKLYNALSYVRAGVSLAKVLKFEGGESTGGSGKSARVKMEEVNGMWQMASGQTGGRLGTFADGGWVNDAQFGLIGERGAKFVIPNWMITSPKYANTVGRLESERVKGAKAFAVGGGIAHLTLPEPVQVETVELLRQLNSQFSVLNQQVITWPTRL
ncbi:hypothetical protein [Rufibacter latericius]|uniref:Uncharacterized protein n=1 Tax=Rufibacter latericius TaxID=2487040 RepID=A0A3M9M900_9BACT|nr:hypothetical protein [Rufibacter latericius]RNI22050.1 hypothetical protein EFB08_23240 [Rufibacter latericius]